MPIDMETNLRLMDTDAHEGADPIAAGAHSTVRLLPVMCAVLAAAYHANHALAQDWLQGSSSDGHTSVQWEYDLEYGTGRVVLGNIDVEPEHEDERLYFGGVVPNGAGNLRFDARVVSLDACTRCTSGSVCPPLTAFTKLQPGQQTEITFNLPAASWETALGPGPLEYGAGFLWSASVCFTVPQAELSQFVSVRPIRHEHPSADLDGDGDVDLRDFALMQNQFTGPR